MTTDRGSRPPSSTSATSATSSPSAGGGVVVARGKIKVDARKALDKLRDHMLVDHHLYACEIARVAVAMSATVLDVDWDSDDVILTFGGCRLLPINAIAHVRDHILSHAAAAEDSATTPEAAADGDALRILGIGISAALGLDPIFVDVYRAESSSSSGSDGGCVRIRFEPRHIDEDSEEAAAPTPEIIATRPSQMPASGNAMQVHVRARLGIGVLGRAVRKETPREVLLLLAAATDAPLAIRTPKLHLQQQQQQQQRRSLPPPAPTVILRVDLDEPSLTRAVLEVLHPTLASQHESSSCLLFLERSIRLARYDLPDCWNVAREGSALPIRIVVDAPKLPTNASRSEIRMDADLAKRVLARIPPALATATSTLEGIVVRGVAPNTTAGRVGHAVEVLGDHATLAEALGAITAEVAIATRINVKPVATEALALLALPLMSDVLGKPLALNDLRGGTTPENPLVVYTGNGPLPEALAPWLAGIPWRRGMAIERALTGLHLASANDLVVQAHEALTRRTRALTHEPSLPKLSSTGHYALREAFAVHEGPFAGLEGEIGIEVGSVAPSPASSTSNVVRQQRYRRSATARLFVDDRPLETTQLPGVALPVDMALAWKDRIRARFAYDGVERDEALSKAVLYALRVAAIAIGERLAHRDHELVRLAIVGWASSTKTLGDSEVNARALGSLASAKVWPTTDADVMTDLSTLEAYARRTGGICIAPARSGRAVDERPVLDAAFVPMLTPLLPPTTRFVPYGRVLARGLHASRAALAQEAGGLPAVAIHHPKVEGFVAVGIHRRRIYHEGFLLRDEAYISRNGPVTVVVDDRSAVPTPDHEGLMWSTPLPGLAREEDALVEVVLDRCERGEVDFSVVAEYVSQSQRKVSERAASTKERDDALRFKALAKRLIDLPEKIERQRLLAAKLVVLGRPKVDLDEILGLGPRSSVATLGDGEVTVAAARDHLRAEILFEGHPIGSSFISGLPVVAVVDVRREVLLSEWTALSAEGARWAKSCIVDAALKLAHDLAAMGGFSTDALALDLWLALSEEALARAIPALRESRWPTVQGGVMALPADVGQLAQLPFGTQAYAAYRPGPDGSPYDAPAIHLPRDWLGDLRRRVLVAAGYELVDVTEPIARLQARRARGLHMPPPKLEGTPSHPLLRTSLADLGVTIADGQIELIDGATSSVFRVSDVDGTLHPVPFALRCPVRIVYRSDEGATDSMVMVQLGTAVEKFVRRLGSSARLTSLPTFVRDRLRALICSALTRKARTGADDAAHVFPDTAGGWHSIDDIVERSNATNDVRMTTDGPPWLPPREEHGLVLFLSAPEAQALSTAVVRIEDITERLRHEKRGAARRAAPPLERIELSDEMRAKCIFSFRVTQEDLIGEIGLLRPTHASLRGVNVHVTMRPLTRVDDPEGWPAIAALNDDSIHPTPGFDAFAEPNQIARIHAAMRLEIGTRMTTLLEAPADAIGIMRLSSPFLVRGAQPPSASPRVVACMGIFWLEPKWPDAPTVHVDAVGITDPYRVPRLAPDDDEVDVDVALQAKTGSEREKGLVVHHRTLPVAGRVYISADAHGMDVAFDEICRWVAHRLPPIVRSTSSRALRKASADEIDAYKWDVALLGLMSEDGKDPIAELAKDRPAAALVRVAARRTPHLMVQTPQDTAKATPLMTEELETMAAQQAQQTQVQQPQQAQPITPSPIVIIDEDLAVPQESFLRGLVRRVVALVSGDSTTSNDAPSAPLSPLAKALADALGEMKLTGDPVASVVETKRGRPVSYDSASRRVIVNSKHATVRKLVDHPSGVLFLLASAVSEINRELVPVTDAEELEVILDLLRANDPGSATGETST